LLSLAKDGARPLRHIQLQYVYYCARKIACYIMKCLNSLKQNS